MLKKFINLADRLNNLPLKLRITIYSLIAIVVIMMIFLTWYIILQIFLSSKSAISSGYQLLNSRKIEVDAGLPKLFPDEVQLRDKENPLNGILYTRDEFNKFSNNSLIAVPIDLSSAARDQAGLIDSDIVYELPTEGGTMRALGIFWAANPSIIGPIRSARTYFTDVTSEFRAIFSHIGQSSVDSQFKYKELDRQSVDFASYVNKYDIKHSECGIVSDEQLVANRVAVEHTYFASLNTLRNCTSSMFSGVKNFDKYSFKQDLVQDKRPLISELNITTGDSSFSSTWIYSPDTNSYKRKIGNNDHIDKSTNNPLIFKNIIVQYVPVNDIGDKLLHINVNTYGSGKAKILLDGKVIESKWAKNSLFSRTQYFNEDSTPVQFNRGKFWIIYVPDSQLSKTSFMVKVDAK